MDGEEGDSKRRRIRTLVLAALVLLALNASSLAGGIDVDALLGRVFASKYSEPYRLTADFSGILVLFVRGRPITAAVAGSYVEWEGPDRQKRRQVSITRLHLPLLLRPFAGRLRRMIEEQVEHQSDSPETFHDHDVFILDELPERRYVLIGIHRAIIDDALERAGRPAARRDAELRREMAERLYTTPGYRERLPRPGPPYALRAVVDDKGNIYDLRLFYDWGAVGTTFTYVLVNDHPVWNTLGADTTGTVGGLGRVDGNLAFTFTNHCFNCSPR